MKKILFAALAATVMLASCSKEDVNKEMDGSPATLTISIGSANTRALGTEGTGELATGNDQAVSDFYVFVFDALGNAVSKHAVNATPAQLNTTTSGTEVYVIANEETAYDATLDAITTKSALEALEVGLATANGGNQTGKRWSSGSEDITWSAATPGTGTVAVQLTYIASRITVKIVNQMSPAYDHGATDPDDLVLNSVAVLNAYGSSTLFGATPQSPNFMTGIAYPGTWANEPTPSTDYAALTDNFTYTTGADNDFYTSSDENVFYYYVFSRDAVTLATAYPTIVTLCGTFDGNDIYFPVHLASYDVLADDLERGKSYDITLTLKGDPTIGGGGVPDPTEPVISATLDVSISVTDWVPVTLAKDFE